MTSDYLAYEHKLNKRLQLCLIPVCIWFLVLLLSQVCPSVPRQNVDHYSVPICVNQFIEILYKTPLCLPILILPSPCLLTPKF